MPALRPVFLQESHKNLRSFLVSNPPHKVAAFLTDCHNVRLFGQRDTELDSIMSLDHDRYQGFTILNSLKIRWP